MFKYKGIQLKTFSFKNLILKKKFSYEKKMCKKVNSGRWQWRVK